MASFKPFVPPRGPLTGLRVVDFSWVVAGPQATRVLADFGAEVIRLEYEARIDPSRSGDAAATAASGSVNGGLLFNHFNRNKRSFSINAVHPQGLDLIKRLIAISDVVVENFRAHVLDSWGLGYEAMQRARPDIIYCSLSGFGHSGRDRGFSTWGPTAQANAGLTIMSGLPGQAPAGWGFSYMDHTAGYYAAAAVLMALHHRNRTGEGQYIDISQIETGLVLTGPAVLDYTVNGRPYRRPGNPPGNRSEHPAVAPHGVYPCAGEDRWIAIAAFNQGQWAALRSAMGDPDWSKQPAFDGAAARVEHQDELDQRISEWTRLHEARPLMVQLQGLGIAAGMVQNAQDRMEDDPQLRERGAYAELVSAELGVALHEVPTPKLSRTPGDLRMPPPLFGEDSSYVLQDLLGLTDDAVVELTAGGVF